MFGSYQEFDLGHLILSRSASCGLIDKAILHIGFFLLSGWGGEGRGGGGGGGGGGGREGGREGGRSEGGGACRGE